MSKKTIVDRFIEGTPAWLEQMKKMQQGQCVMCGTIPKEIEQLLEEIKIIKEKAWKYDELSK